MDWAEQIQRHRRALIVAGISLAHGAAFAAVLTLKVKTPPPIPAEPITIELAEIAAAPKPQPEPTPEPEPAPTPPPQQTAEAPPPKQPPAAPLPVLTQNTGNPGLGDQPPVITSDVPPSDLPPGKPTATPNQLANVLARANCRRQIANQDPECEDQDPFDALAEKFELQQAAALVPPELNGAYAPGAFERYMSGEGHYSSPQGRDASVSSQLHLWPDQDLFEEGQSRSTNQASRIRNGKGLMDPGLERELRAGRD
jgi:hypothetical protein